MKRFLVLTKAMLLMHLRNRMTLFWNLAFPVFVLVIYSQIFGTNQVGSVNYMAWAVPGVVVFNIVAFGLLGSGTIMVNMREQGILRRLQASPMPAGQLVGSYLVVNVLIAVLQSTIIVLFSALVFETPLTVAGALRAFPMAVSGILAFVALGQVISGVAPTAGVAVAVGQIVNFGQMFITDMIMPMELLPEWIQRIAPYLPAYAVVQLVRPPLIDGRFSPELWSNLYVVAAYTVVAGIVAARLFRWSPRV
ncbi:MAG: ABC transporter permease [Anaerolineae bacterium]|nr:MAG: ABC transporter permease [Anaerolineae bacterium]